MNAISASWTDSLIMLRRNFKHIVRNPVTIFNGALMPVVIMLMFVYVLGNAFSVGERYIEYATPGLILLAITYGLSGTAVSVNSDMTKGIINRFKVMNVSRGAVLNGHVAATMLGSSVAIAAIIGMAFALGFRSSATAGEWFGAIGIIVAIAFAAAWFTVALGMAAKTPESAGLGVVPLILLPFLSSAIVPADKMGQGVRQFAEYQPFTPIIESVRGLLAGHPSGGYVAAALGWGAGVALVGGVWAVGQLSPPRLRPLLRCLGEPRVAEATPRGLFDPGHIRLRPVRQSAHGGTRREQPCGLLIPLAAQRQVRDPDEGPRDQGRMPRLRRGSEGHGAVLAGLVEALREGTRAVVRDRPDVGPLRVQHGGRDAELPVRLLGVAAPASQLRPGQGQLGQRIRPRDPVRVPPGLGHGRRARLLITKQPIQLSPPRPHLNHIFADADLGDHRDRLCVELARAGELAAHGDSVRQLPQRELDPPSLAEHPELAQRQLKIRVRIPPALAEHDPHLAELQPGQCAHPRVVVGEQRFPRGQELVRRPQHALQRGHERQRRVAAATALAEPVGLVDPLHRLILVSRTVGHEHHDQRS